MEPGYEVRGHMCAGLEAYLEASMPEACETWITEAGQIEGCDSRNPVIINNCPWCGARLPKLGLPLPPCDHPHYISKWNNEDLGSCLPCNRMDGLVEVGRAEG